MRIAAVQDAPVFLDREASVEKVVRLIREAGAAGVDLLGFPEGFLPGHPGWVELLPLDGLTMGLNRRLFQNAVEMGSADLRSIQDACRESGVAVVLGFCERLPNTTGTLFNSQVHIDESGSVVGHHQKYVPTVGERIVHAPGRTGSRNSSPMAGVTVSGLICGENSNPLGQYAAAVAYPTVHVAAWPQHFGPGFEVRELSEMVSRALAYSLKAFVLNAVQTITPEMVDAYGEGFAGDYLRDPASPGRASIVGPGGDVIARADGPEAQLVVADIDPADVIAPKFVQDFAGHYNRPEIFAHLLPTGRRDV